MAEYYIPIAASGDDGKVTATKVSAGWPPTSGESVVTDGVLVELRRQEDSGIWTWNHGYLRFDTSAIDDTSTVVSAKLRISVTNILDTDGVYLAADWYDWSPAIDTSDWSNNPGSNAVSTTSYPLSVIKSGVNDIILQNAATYVNKSGYTYLRLWLYDTSDPTGTNDLYFWSYDSTKVNNSPQLVVYYTEANPTSLYYSAPPIVR